MNSAIELLMIINVFFFLDTFQALIQYPDVVTAQAAKMVPIDIKCDLMVFSQSCLVMERTKFHHIFTKHVHSSPIQIPPK